MCIRSAPDGASYTTKAPRKRRPRDVDGRTTPARRYAALVSAFETEIGGDLTEAERALVEQAAVLTLRVEQLRADVIAGRQIDDDLIVKIAGASRRALAAISSRSAERKPASAMTLQDYMAKQAERDALADDSDDDDQ